MTATPSQPTFHLFVGVDIAAASFAASWTRGGQPCERARTFAQTPEGFTMLQTALATTGISPAQTLLVLEATGSYWVSLAVSFHQAGYAVSVVNPAHAHAFAKSLPRRAKTDALDAQLLAQFAHERQPARWTPPAQVYHELRQRLVVRDGLLQMRQQARNQRHALTQWPVQVAEALQQLDAVITTWTPASRRWSVRWSGCCARASGQQVRCCSAAFLALGQSQPPGCWWQP